jgi:hypothetical protein
MRVAGIAWIDVVDQTADGLKDHGETVTKDGAPRCAAG